MLTENDIKRLSLTEECQTWMNANTLVETMKKSKERDFLLQQQENLTHLRESSSLSCNFIKK